MGLQRDRYRWRVPELPFGAHTTPMPDDADPSLLAVLHRCARHTEPARQPNPRSPKNAESRIHSVTCLSRCSQ